MTSGERRGYIFCSLVLRETNVGFCVGSSVCTEKPSSTVSLFFVVSKARVGCEHEEKHPLFSLSSFRRDLAVCSHFRIGDRQPAFCHAGRDAGSAAGPPSTAH